MMGDLTNLEGNFKQFRFVIEVVMLIDFSIFDL